MTFRVVILKRAEGDLQRIFRWLSARSPSGASAWLTAYEHLQERLIAHADTFALAQEHAKFDHDLRQGLFKTRRGRVYRVIFMIDEDEVRILRVRGPGQNPIAADDV